MDAAAFFSAKLSVAKNKHPKAAFHPPNSRQPRVAVDVGPQEKKPRVEAPAIPYGDRPSWRLKTLDLGGPWCWRKMGAEDLNRVLERLQHLETMTWREILSAGGHEHHAIEIARLSKSAQERLSEIKLDDVDDVISLRVTGKERVFGVRFGGVLRLLWWDPEHNVYPVKKKYT